MQIRVAEERDAAALVEIYSYYVEKTAITFEYETPSTEKFTERIHNIKEKCPYIVAEENGEILGYAYGSAFHPRAAYGWCAEMSIYVKHDRRGSGAGGRLTVLWKAFLREMGVVILTPVLRWHRRKMNILLMPVWIFTNISVINEWESSTDVDINSTAGIIWYGWKR